MGPGGGRLVDVGPVCRGDHGARQRALVGWPMDGGSNRTFRWTKKQPAGIESLPIYKY